MDGPAALGQGSIVAPLNFLVPMAEKPVAYNYEPPPGKISFATYSGTMRVAGP